MNDIALLIPVKIAIDEIAGYLAQPEIEVTAFGVEQFTFHTSTRVSVRVGDKINFTIYINNEREKP